MRQNIGLAALADVARLDGAPNAYHLGFVLGPRINAAGRMDEAGLGVELLLTAEGWRAKDLARQLDDFNQQRQAVEQDILAQAQAQIDAAGEDSPVLLAANDHWHQGVIGIVASRLKDIYQKPVAVAAINADGIAVGSARSVAGFNFGNAVLAAVQDGILIGGGGHGMAAGFKIRRENLPRFSDFLAARHAADIKIRDMTRMVTVDAVIHPRAVGAALWADIAQLEPIGAGNPQPKLAMLHVQLTHADILKEQHLRLTLQSLDGTKVAAMAFRVMQGPLGQFLYQQRGQQIHVLGQLRPNDFNGRRSFQFLIEDAAAVGLDQRI
jgi:single-stranded-DNA-specific exonuclease